jgi:AraC-like DNA-binding protein
MGNTALSYNYMGKFTTTEDWIHPQVKEKTFEIIYVTSGEVFLFEGEKEYALRENDLVVLAPGIVHGGSRHSTGKTSFYWIHFTLDSNDTEYGSFLVRNFSNRAIFKEMLHHSHMPNSPTHAKESCLCHLLSLISQSESTEDVSALAREIFEWTRINALSGLCVKDVATHFGYNAEYISRLIKRDYGTTLKCLIDDFLIGKAKNHLSNTDSSVKEISNLLGFATPNTFIHFFKYHEGLSPTQYRNLYTHTHMNKK